MANINCFRVNNIVNETKFGKESKSNNLLKETNLNNMNNKSYKCQSIKNANEKISNNIIKTKSKVEVILSKSEETENIEKDVSMLSINNDSLNCKYHLPAASELEDNEISKKFLSDIIARRSINRTLMADKLRYYGTNIFCVSYDSDTGDVMVLEILDYMQELECRTMPLGSDFLAGTKISIGQRCQAINWLYSVSQKLNIERYSVYDGMAIADRYVKAKGLSIATKDYSLVVATSWFIACKWELVEYPYIEDLCNLIKVDSPSIIHEWEMEILKTIDFYLGIPNPISFLRPLTLMKQREKVSHNIAKCLVEVCLFEYDLTGHPAHIIASASYCLTMTLCLRQKRLASAWIPLVQFAMGLDVEDIRPVVKILAKILINNNFSTLMPGVYGQYKSIFEVLSRRKADLLDILND